MWFSFTAVGAVTTCIIIVSLWEKFQTNPTITGLDTDFHNWEVPFPAVTICDLNPVDEELLERYINSAFLIFLLILQIVRHSETLFYDCEWRGDSEECYDLLVPVFTEMGFCYAFNSRHAEVSWPWQSQTEAEPFAEAFIHETDAKWSFMFNSYRNDTTLDIYIHATEEMAGLEQSAQHSWDRRVEKVSFSVKHTYTTEDARQLSIRQRRCVFADEQSLETSPIYTYSACMQQCRMQRSRKFCKCVPHFYPKINGYKHCTIVELACIADHAAAITDVTWCTCELGCSHTVYEVEKLTEVE
ncbi:hypothetical protein MSG28_007489 [Choristoneura fumiferana]|uniref:Uncharacterized protein n=1 Tax=Choristoneura fumiferana TaxID=7141 RepID=A0ACC0JXH8_CHOFU|nr:hypothetical protein MSG28_007489 [Choristoneura fumiferana]